MKIAKIVILIDKNDFFNFEAIFEGEGVEISKNTVLPFFKIRYCDYLSDKKKIRPVRVFLQKLCEEEYIGTIRKMTKITKIDI